jgi:hypothetical protein
MSQQDWERDIINRQRNIVFPDTNLNEGRFYRNIASGKAVFSTGQKVSLLMIVAFQAVVNALAVAAAYFDLPDTTFVVPIGFSMAWLGFWIFLAMNALMPPQPVRKYRRGYRSSSKRQS